MTPEPLIELNDVNVVLNGRAILRSITWSLRPGEHWSVVGANGSGKSTFLRLLRGEIWPSPGSGGRIYRLGNTAQSTAVGIKETVALVSPEAQQRYLRQEWQLTGRSVIESGFGQGDYVYTRLSRIQKVAVEAVAERLHIEPFLRRDVQTLSTGELRKVLIARSLVCAPRILLLDEVCDGLDAVFRRGMLDLINEIALAGTQVIYTTHRADEALPAITHELLLADGREIRSGLVPSRRRPDLRPLPRFAPALPAAPVSRARKIKPLIEIRDADVFLGRRRVLRDIAWQLVPKENWVVLGGNGAGKSTFLKLVASDVYPAVGASINRFGLTPQNTIWDLRRRIGCVSPLLQTEYRDALTGAEVVASGFFASIGLVQPVSTAQRRRVKTLFDRFGLQHLAAKPFNRVSFGEARKLLTLRALARNPRLLILDEPFDGLDAAARKDFASALDQVVSEGAQLLVVTHHLDDLPSSINRGLFLRDGQIAAQGPWPEIRFHPQVMSLFGSDGAGYSNVRR